jgi:ketosteroid isomerase-like protein
MTAMTPQELAYGVARAVENRDGAAMAALFTDDGVYHDVFYGAFEGRAKIEELVNDWIYRAATQCRWQMYDPVSDGKTLYVRYTWSYVSTLPEAQGKRVGFDGVSIMKLRDGLISEYREIANSGPALLDIGFPPERVAKILKRQGEALQRSPDYARHREP